MQCIPMRSLHKEKDVQYIDWSHPTIVELQSINISLQTKVKTWSCLQMETASRGRGGLDVYSCDSVPNITLCGPAAAVGPETGGMFDMSESQRSSGSLPCGSSREMRQKTELAGDSHFSSFNSTTHNHYTVFKGDLLYSSHVCKFLHFHLGLCCFYQTAQAL